MQYKPKALVKIRSNPHLFLPPANKSNHPKNWTGDDYSLH